MENTENNVVETTEIETAAKTYTAEEVQSMLDKRVNQALEKRDKIWEKKMAQQMTLSALDEGERAKAEKDNRIAELEEQLAMFQIERNKSELKSVLASRGLSAEFADMLAIGDDIEANQALIEKFDKLYRAEIKAAIEKKLAGTAPKGNGGGTVELTKEAFKAMSLSEQGRLYAENPDLYKKLIN